MIRVMRLSASFRLGLNLLLRDSGGLSPLNIFSWTNPDALDCISFTRLHQLRIISFRYKATHSWSCSTSQLLDPDGHSGDGLKKDEIFNERDRFVDTIYLWYIIGTNSWHETEIYNKIWHNKLWNMIIS